MLITCRSPYEPGWQFLTGNRRGGMAGIPHILVGGLVFRGIFVPTLAAAFYLHRRKESGQG